MVVECCVPYCKATSDFHNFPANRDRRLRWLQAIQIFHLDEATVSNSFRKVCARHFRSSDYQRHANGLIRLKHDSVPTQNLPNPLWMEHSYANRSVKASDPNIFKAKKQKPTNVAVKKSDSKKVVVDFDQGIVNVSSVSSNGKDHEEEVQALKLTILELKKQLMMKEKIIKTQNTALRIKDRQLRQLRTKLKGRNSKQSIMKCLKDIFSEDKETILFFEMQLKNKGKSKNAFRFTAEQKSFCVAIYKQSPKAYRNSLRKFFILPSKRTLGRHSAQLIFESGINSKFFEYLKNIVSEMAEIDKYCALVWDEMALKAHLDYNKLRDTIDGFVEMLSMRRPSFATHALVFMVRGINRSYKEPVAHFYTDGLKSFELVEMVKLVGKSVLDTGLKVMLSVCDQSANNVSAINALMTTDPETKTGEGANSGKLLTYKLGDTSVIHCYDVPHLLKGTRNNLETKNLHHTVFKRWSHSDSNLVSETGDTQKRTDSCNKVPGHIDDKQEVTDSWDDQSYSSDDSGYTQDPLALWCDVPDALDDSSDTRKSKASWDDVSDMYDLSLKGNKKLLPKITQEHIKPQKLKMKVSTACQVFSQTYGQVMLKCSEKKLLQRDCSETAQILMFFNDVFDSLNGSCATTNELKSPVTQNSIHFQYWDYALDMLSEMQFIDNVKGKPTNRTKNIQNWQSTIRGYYELSKKCLSLGMKEIALRNANQDALENFFGGIKTNCQNAKTPIAIHFRSAYITSILNNLTSSNSLKTNCEKDSSTSLIKNFHDLMLKAKNKSLNRACTDKKIGNKPNPFDYTFEAEVPKLSCIEEEELTCTSSLICNDFLKSTDCKSCIDNIQSVTVHDDISMSYPSDTFKSNFMKIYRGINNLLPELCTVTPLKKTLISNVHNIILDKMGCKKHYKSVKTNFIESTTLYAITEFCKDINDLLSKKTNSLSDNVKGIQIYEVALAFRKKKRIGKFSDTFKT